MDKGYENSACRTNDGVDGHSSTVEMEREAVNNVKITVSKCCGGGGSNEACTRLPDTKISNVLGPEVKPNVCLPKCPAVKASPWDPIKTWSAAILSVAMFVWTLVGVYAIKF